MRLRVALAGAVLLGLGTTAHAQVQEMEMRGAFFDQTGHGYQSVAGPPQGPGSEDVLVFEPLFHLLIKQSEAWSHEVDITVDIVSNASVDAIDAVSTASAVNEAATIDVSSAYRTGDTTLALRYGGHLEEPFRSVFAGGAVTQRLADDNFAIALSGLVTFDVFDHVNRLGHQTGEDGRQSVNANLSMSQILSPTTVVDASYGFTLQTGSLTTTYNSVPIVGGSRGDEVFPAGRRYRHAFSGRLSQHIPDTRSTLKASYRYYVDNYDLTAHTVEGQYYQYLVDWLYLRLSYRYHWQSGVDFYGTAFSPEQMGPETSDSDLAPFTAHEVGLKFVLLADRSPWAGLKRSFIEASFYHYWRTNDLQVNWLTIAFGRKF